MISFYYKKSNYLSKKKTIWFPQVIMVSLSRSFYVILSIVILYDHYESADRKVHNQTSGIYLCKCNFNLRKFFSYFFLEIHFFK